jgi:hypothetical protein
VALSGSWSHRAESILSSRGGRVAFAWLPLLVLLAGRWPTFFVHDTLNNDEAQAVAQAITALHDPIPWRSFDGNTCGPLNTYILTLPAAFGVPISFFSSRVISVLLQWFDAFAVMCSVDRLAGKTIARIAPLSAALFFACSVKPEFIDYGGETLSIAIGMAALLSILRIGRRSEYALLAGVFIGAMPLAKLQSIPLAASILLTALVAIYSASTRRIRDVGLLCAGCVTVQAIILGTSAAGGSIYDFWESYIVTSVSYVSSNIQPISFLTSTEQFGLMFCSLLFVACSGAIIMAFRRRSSSRKQVGHAACVWLIFGASIATIYAPGRGSLNYLTFAVFPLVLIAAVGLSSILESMPSIRARRLVVLAFATMSLFVQPIRQNQYIGAANAPSPLDKLLTKYVSPGERLAIWGWRPQYYVDTQTIMGTRDSITRYQQSAVMNPEIGYFRQRYLGDMSKNKPLAFLDMGQESFGFPHEAWQELNETIKRDYCYVGAVGDNRLYLRRMSTSACI